MSESRAQMYAAELAEEVRSEWSSVGLDFPALEAKCVSMAEVVLMYGVEPNPFGLLQMVQSDGAFRYFGDFSGVDFTTCQQIKLDPPKPKREVKPAINLSEAGEKYRGIGWCDAAEVRP